MWVSQTYLNGPRQAFPIYGYVIADMYADWGGPAVARLKTLLAEFGRRTEARAAVFVPGDNIDRAKIGKEMDHRFAPLVHQKFGGPGYTFGILFSDRLLEDLDDDGSNGRWAFFRFDPNLNLLGTDVELADFLRVAEGVGIKDNNDPVQELVLAVHRTLPGLPSVVGRIDWSLTGPSIKGAELARAFQRRDHLATNVWN